MSSIADRVVDRLGDGFPPACSLPVDEYLEEGEQVLLSLLVPGCQPERHRKTARRRPLPAVRSGSVDLRVHTLLR